MAYIKEVKKKPPKENISIYKGGKILVTMNKEKSLYTINMILDKNGFVDVIKYKTKSGQIHEINTIVEKYIDMWISTYEKEGFIKI